MAENDTSKFQIFRAEDGRDLMEEGCMTVAPFNDVARKGMDKLMANGLVDGDEVKVLVNIPGFSVTNVWFKHGYPLPLHSHSADCLYYIVAGTIKLGTEELGPRDSFFVPADVPYTYKPGPDGVELLEIRTAAKFDFVNYSKSAAFWDKAADSVEKNRENWKTAERPKIDA